MFKQDYLTNNDHQQVKVSGLVKKINNRRASKMLVELSIGVIGIIAIMLAQIASHHSDRVVDMPSKNDANVVYQLTDSVANKVASLAEVSPMATKVNLLNILF